MDIDTDRIDEAVLALLYLGLHEHNRAWKSFDWGAMERLHKRDLISNPASKAKSVVFTEEGLERAEAIFATMFARAR
jgi:hypothetical protein